jgi:hypothetical protein
MRLGFWVAEIAVSGLDGSGDLRKRGIGTPH